MQRWQALPLTPCQSATQVSRRLPPAVRVLDQVLQLTNAQQRLQLLQKALAGGQGELPGVDMDSLSATCGQFIDDMEDQEVR